MTDYAGNTKKEKKEKKDKAKEEKAKKLEKVVTTEVIQKPKSLGRKFKDIFLGGDARSALRYVGADVLLPALRDMAVDTVTRGAERLIYGESMYRSRRPPFESRVQYNRPYSSNPLDRRYVGPREPERLPSQTPTYRGRPMSRSRRLDDVIIPMREEAENVVSLMMEIIEMYEVVSVGDYFDLVGLEQSPIDQKWGWPVLNNIQIRQVRQGYVIDLPPVEEL